MKKYKIIIADSNRLFAELLKKIITEKTKFEVISVSSSGVSAIRDSLQLRPDLLITGSLLPDITMYQVVKELMRTEKKLSYMFVVKDTDSDLLKFLGTVSSIAVIKDDTDIEEFITALSTVANGDRYISRSILEELRSVKTDEPVYDILDSITPREREILFWISKGLSNLEIAEKIILSEKTVKNHVSHILKKLNIRDRTKAAALAWEEGLGFIPEEFFSDGHMW